MDLEQLMDLYGDDVLRLCIAYLGDRHLAEDAFQDTFVKAWKNLSAFRGDSSMKTWLCRIAANTCRDLLRSGWLRMWRKSQPLETLLALSAGDVPQPPSPVLEAVGRLSGKYREVVVLYYDQNLNVREISELLRLPVNTVTTRLRRARGLLQKELKGEIDL